MGLVEALAVAGFTGIVSSVGTVAAMKTDISWIKQELSRLCKRVKKLEEAKL